MVQARDLRMATLPADLPLGPVLSSELAARQGRRRVVVMQGLTRRPGPIRTRQRRPPPWRSRHTGNPCAQAAAAPVHPALLLLESALQVVASLLEVGCLLVAFTGVLLRLVTPHTPRAPLGAACEGLTFVPQPVKETHGTPSLFFTRDVEPVLALDLEYPENRFTIHSPRVDIV